MKTLLLAASAALLLAVPCFGGGSPNPGDVEAAFGAARLADDLTGTIADPAHEVDVTVYVSANSKVSATLSCTTPGTVPSLKLCDENGVDQEVTGGAFDKSVPGSNVVTWKKVPLAATGAFTFVVKASAADSWRLKLSGTLATIKQTFNSTENLGVNAQAQVSFEGLRGGKLAYTLAAAQKSKFKGALFGIKRPDGTTMEDTPTAANGKVTLDQDGLHQLIFQNAGSGIGAWKVTTTVTPPAVATRRGYVTPQGTALVPTVTSVTPPRDYHKDDAAAVTLKGKNFQPGIDVRLVRNGFEDIVATDVAVLSETQVTCMLNLATAPITGVDSLGVWKVGVWNAPVYTVPGDPKTLVKDSPTKHQTKTFECLAASSISLPPGVMKETEVWHLVFNSDFQEDLNRIGLGSEDDEKVAAAAKNAVVAYVVCYLRDLFKVNETNGNLANTSPEVSFVVGQLPNPAGKPGVDFNRIEIGGAWQSPDQRDPSDALFWGFAPLDPGNTHRDNLSVDVDDGLGGTTRIGHGARTRVLDPASPSAAATWIAATAPLRQIPLDEFDRVYFGAAFSPISVADANRYRDIVHLVSRTAREIAGIAGHHIARAMGLPSAGPSAAGPMGNPDTAGNFWPLNGSLAFAANDLATLRTNAVPGTLPGKSKALVVTYFPLISTQPSYLPNLVTVVPYSVDWNYVGGRANAQVTDYSVVYNAGNPPLDLVLSYQGLAGTARLYIDASTGRFNCDINYFRIRVTDTVRKLQYSFIYRLNVLPNIPLLRPGNEQNQATNCKNVVLSTP